MSHIPDNGKMVSDTPRTDEAECESHIGISHFGHQDLCDAYKFARQLEHELNAANERIKRLEDSLREIANQDYRGNRSTESEIAFRALQP